MNLSGSYGHTKAFGQEIKDSPLGSSYIVWLGGNRNSSQFFECADRPPKLGLNASYDSGRTLPHNYDVILSINKHTARLDVQRDSMTNL